MNGGALIDQLRDPAGPRPVSSINRRVDGEEVSAVFSRYGITMVAEKMEDDKIVEDRITSYNVCYTKLLRASPQGGERRGDAQRGIGNRQADGLLAEIEAEQPCARRQDRGDLGQADDRHAADLDGGCVITSYSIHYTKLSKGRT